MAKSKDVIKKDLATEVINKQLASLDEYAEVAKAEDFIPPYLSVNKADKDNIDINTRHKVYNSTTGKWYEDGVEVYLLGYMQGRKRLSSDGTTTKTLCKSRDGITGDDLEAKKDRQCSECPCYGYNSGYTDYCKDTFLFAGVMADTMSPFWLDLSSYAQYKPFKKLLNTYLLGTRKHVMPESKSNLKLEWFWIKVKLQGNMDGQYGRWNPTAVKFTDGSPIPVMDFLHPKDEELSFLIEQYKLFRQKQMQSEKPI